MEKSTLVLAAEHLARKAHAGQERKGGAAYIVHPERVAKTLTEHGFDELTVAAGWLHDTLEDTAITETEITALDPVLLPIIRAVTEDGTLPWAERKKQFTDTLQKATYRSMAVACADRIDNLSNFLADYSTIGPDLWLRWPERTPQDKLHSDQYFLMMLRAHWKHELIERLSELIREEKEIAQQPFTRVVPEV